MGEVAPIIEFINDILESENMPKSIRERIKVVVGLLEENSNLSVSKALQELESVSEEVDSHLRTQLFSVVSMLESL